MSNAEMPHQQPWYDISTKENRRKTLRTLVLAVLVFAGLSIACDSLWPPSENIQRLVEQEWESMSKRKFWIGLITSVLVTGCGLFGLYKLWRYQQGGAPFLAVYAFFPPFFASPFSVVYSSASAYWGGLSDLAIGMLLFLCWTQPDATDPEPQAATSAPSGTA